MTCRVSHDRPRDSLSLQVIATFTVVEFTITHPCSEVYYATAVEVKKETKIFNGGKML